MGIFGNKIIEVFISTITPASKADGKLTQFVLSVW
jgi:hypothetical protein